MGKCITSRYMGFCLARTVEREHEEGLPLCSLKGEENKHEFVGGKFHMFVLLLTQSLIRV